MDFLTPDFTPAYPEIFLLVMVCVVMLTDLIVGERRRYLAFFLAQLTLIGCAILTLTTFSSETNRTFSGMFIDDAMSDILKLMVYATVAAVLIYSRIYIAARGMFRGEFFSLALFATLGMMVMISAERMKSVLTAPAIFCSSSEAGSMAVCSRLPS